MQLPAINYTFKWCSYRPVVASHQAAILLSLIHSFELQNLVPTVVKLNLPKVIKLRNINLLCYCNKIFCRFWDYYFY